MMFQRPRLSILLSALLVAAWLHAPQRAEARRGRVLGRTARSLGAKLGRLRTSLRARRALGRRLTRAQSHAVFEAHLVGHGQLGKDGKTRARQHNYTFGQLRHKAAILRAAGIGASERRVLMKKGVVGKKGKKRRRERSELADEVHESDNPSFWRRLFRQEERDGHYSAKGGHKERSKHHKPQHNEHWKKEDKRRD